MAKAPTPGVGKRAADSAATRRTLEITLCGEEKTVALNNLSFRERAQVRKETGGLPLEAYWAGELTIQSDSLQVVWWLARRANAEPNLRLHQVVAEWPDPFDLSMVSVKWVDAPDDLGSDDPES